MYSGTPQYVVSMDGILAEATVSRYCCSNCWGHLLRFHTKVEEDGKTHIEEYVLCHSCLDETRGYVTKSYAERKRQESEVQYTEARHNLAETLGIPTSSGKSPEELLRDLGF